MTKSAQSSTRREGINANGTMAITASSPAFTCCDEKNKKR
jgi:hypothetical protein